MSQVLIEKNNRILNVTLNRPEAHNALSVEMMKLIQKAFESVKKDKTIRAVHLKANGPSFCAGGDLNWMRASAKFTLAQNIKDATQLSNMYESIFNCPTPVLASVHGNIFGGGLGLIATCDVVASTMDTKFCFSELKIGVVPSIIAPYVLRKIPEKDARQLFLTAELFKTDKALQCGLIHYVGLTEQERNQFISERLEMISHNAPEGTRVTKDLLHKLKSLNHAGAKKLTIKTIAQRRVSKEGQEGLKSFFEKKDPSWK
ncbi:MAG: enoyl-CoA hydratase/isomerase family protein [Oligoflexia bacterium]|nr:enoyl-CoA hydratase/isomerase family protein [Oligoflexia bacterium]